ncbi:hypothetical protein Pst134EA_017658 [Puccinia striiformis f. sp. tritici]|uniref:hypothetical protein n=1 Tax=Puccinia striiformis f. sp. tritici TaxID=168172 RepID=UPI0020077EEB|nr:hypothetical protein Pst134EA_017658 [Puccinia striiformis f. sp. tritici]KAH9461349.1 hypothetical protein Pst134EA_017658 [Puccinia striiformis f. sp. tritici]
MPLPPLNNSAFPCVAYWYLDQLEQSRPKTVYVRMWQTFLVRLCVVPMVHTVSFRLRAWLYGHCETGLWVVGKYSKQGVGRQLPTSSFLVWREKSGTEGGVGLLGFEDECFETHSNSIVPL